MNAEPEKMQIYKRKNYNMWAFYFASLAASFIAFLLPYSGEIGAGKMSPLMWKNFGIVFLLVAVLMSLFLFFVGRRLIIAEVGLTDDSIVFFRDGGNENEVLDFQSVVSAKIMTDWKMNVLEVVLEANGRKRHIRNYENMNEIGRKIRARLTPGEKVIDARGGLMDGTAGLTGKFLAILGLCILSLAIYLVMEKFGIASFGVPAMMIFAGVLLSGKEKTKPIGYFIAGLGILSILNEAAKALVFRTP